MDDMMEKLQSVLNDEESMKQIKELAEMLSADSQNDTKQEAAESGGMPDFSKLFGGNSQPASNGDSKKSQTKLPDLSKLLSGLGGMGNKNTAPPPPPSSPTGDFDVGKLLMLRSIIAKASEPDNNVALLLALRPLMKEESQIKIDRLVKVFKLFTLYPALKESGLLGGDLLGLL